MGKSPSKKGVQVAGRRRSRPEPHKDDGGREGGTVETLSPTTTQTVKGAGTGVRGDDDDPKHGSSRSIRSV